MDYKSHATLLGLPLVHIANARLVDGRLQRGVARGWIAIGDISYGVLVALGGVAVGGSALGGISVGLIALGGLGMGLLCLGGLALGGYAVGGLALGIVAVGGGAIAVYDAEGGLAVAGHAARGGMAIARDYAVGGHAEAAHANDQAARQHLESSPVRVGRGLAKRITWISWSGVAVMLVLLYFKAKVAAKPPPLDEW